ncbi:MAG: E1-E2 ATPase-associated domain protein [uncultured Thiotrichaceae bacterium]|uniref:E1-E2 ATPase-associated domain protein n=1 Tax=uncultured Thiotrichaceae bacterium TaxID=298394 RepID=A0A6S6TJX1_9GAMM|nr:MAG: E1-E2 ATPase-associated domain protein [uncultured Thiotrichaceae bacterium]
MIQFGIILTAGGIACALWRDYRKKQRFNKQAALPNVTGILPSPDEASTQNDVYDDVGEVHHYQQVSWYALALTASGTWFYPPIKLISTPLLGYTTYYFFKTINKSDRGTQKSPMTIFEGVSIMGSLVLGSTMATALLLIMSFSIRKLLLQAGNISNNVGFSKPIGKHHTKVWVLRDGAEVEMLVSELQDDDQVVLHAGDTIMLHGHVIEGQAEILQFSLRKKMKMIEKNSGDQVHPFTKLASGHLLVQLK